MVAVVEKKGVDIQDLKAVAWRDRVGKGKGKRLDHREVEDEGTLVVGVTVEGHDGQWFVAMGKSEKKREREQNANFSKPCAEV